MAAKPIPEGYHTVTPYLVVRGAQKEIDFAKKAFGAQLAFEPLRRPDGSIMHAELTIGDSRLMMSDADERHPAMASMLHLYVPNVDAAYQRAISAGGSSVMEPADQFYGDRSGGVKDPFGNQWWIGTHKEDLAPAELKRRAEAHLKAQHRAA
jgi:PhnB protein